jgi:hypothetical protein
MDITSNGMTNAVAILSLLVSVILAMFYFRDRRHAKYSIANDYISEVLAWYAEAIAVLVRLKESIALPTSAERAPDLARLSALIERGRFFFPNIDSEGDVGKEKPTAYRGFRNLVLDFLVASYQLHKMDTRNEHVNQAEQLVRHFTSSVFEIVRPKERLDQIRAMTDRYFVKLPGNQTVLDFLEEGDLSTVAFMWQK